MTKIFTYDDIQGAYLKLKKYYYYDHSIYLIKKQLALFEYEDCKEKLEILKTNLNLYLQNKDNDFINNLIAKIKVSSFIKSVENDGEDHLCEFDYDNKIKVNLNYIINAPIEIHIISILWIMQFGKYFYNGEYSYGNELEKNFDSPYNKKLFKPYFSNYTKWRDRSLDKIEELNKANENAIFISMDIKRYYYNVNIDFDELKKLSSYDELDTKRLTSLLEHIHSTYSEKLNKVINIGNKKVLPIGLLTSNLLANWFLNEVDERIIKNIKPYHYGRYVDDMILVFKYDKTNSNIFSSKEKILDDLFVKNDLLKREADKYIFSDKRDIFLNIYKLKIHSFSIDSGIFKLQQLKKEIMENSSEFREIPNADDFISKFNENIYNINFSNSSVKLGNIQDISQDKHKISTYFSKLLKLSLYLPSSFNSFLFTKIMRFMTPKTSIEMFRNLHKIFSILLIKNEKMKFVKLYELLINTINDLNINDVKVEHIEKLKTHSKESINTILAMVFSIDLKFYESIKNDLKLPNEFRELILAFRKSNLFDNNLVPFSLLNYTSLNILDTNFCFYKEYNSSMDIKVELQDNLLEFSPRFIHIEEFLLFAARHVDDNNLKKEEDINNFIISQYLKTNFNHTLEWRGNIERDLNSNLKKERVDGIKRYSLYTEKLKDGDIKIGLGNISFLEKSIEENITNYPSDDYEKLKNINHILNEAIKNKVNFLVLPELAIPYKYLSFIVKKIKHENIALISGIEHIVYKDKVLNLLFTHLPFNVGSFKYSFINFRLKNYYSPAEKEMIEKANLKVPIIKPKYNIFSWNDLFFVNFNCFEVADIQERAKFKSEIDLFCMSVYNKDIPYFSNLVESLSRDLHCYVIQVNTTNLGDNRLTQPSESIFKDLIKLKGGQNPTLLIHSVNFNEIKQFQLDYYNDNLNESDRKKFKPLPPNFNVATERMRAYTKSLKIKRKK